MRNQVALSANSGLVIAAGSGHGIPFDRPGVVIDSVVRVVAAARAGAPLQ